MKKFKNNRFTNWTAESTKADLGYRIDVDGVPKYWLPAELIIGSPDWVEEKDFVITAFIYLPDNELCKLNKNGNYSFNPDNIGSSSEKLLNNSHCEIFSVLCNGIEWKVGDKMQFSNLTNTITGFKIANEDQMYAEFDTGGTGAYKFGNWNIKNLTPAKKVILTQTEIVNALDKLSIDINNLITKLNEKI